MKSTAGSTGTTADRALLWSPAHIERHFDAIFPNRKALGWTFEIEDLRPLAARIRLPFHERNVRPGRVMSGPAMFHLADYGFWVAIIGMLGEAGVGAVTANLNISYLRLAAAGHLIGDVRLTKLGRRLATGDVEIRCAGRSEMVAHATASYAIGEA